jgi:predicted 3-demethylubiquinone-9 3-methyltransferase (glyoxalase superfamily)
MLPMKFTQKITPFLWFDKEAEQAAKFYVSIFPKSKLKNVTRYGDHPYAKKGSVMTAEFMLCGQSFTGLNGGPMEEFKINGGISFVVHCKDQKEVDYLWKKLPAGGGKTIQCGWLKDKFGVYWQIVPNGFLELILSKDKAAAGRAMAAMMKMTKLDIAELKAAAKGRA